jgi:hypothetical protein
MIVSHPTLIIALIKTRPMIGVRTKRPFLLDGVTAGSVHRWLASSQHRDFGSCGRGSFGKP